jgi:hypothetical protein
MKIITLKPNTVFAYRGQPYQKATLFSSRDRYGRLFQFHRQATTDCHVEGVAYQPLPVRQRQPWRAFLKHWRQRLL